LDVSGIGTATFNSIKDHITVGELQSDEQEEEEEEEELPEQVASSTPPQTQTQTQNQTGGYPPPVLRAEIIGESTSLVGAGSFFDAAAYNAAGEPLVVGVRYVWSFGDGATAEGKRTFHAYAYPGKYRVQLSIAYSYSSALAQLTVNATQGALVLTAENDGSFLLWNRSALDVDVGWWSFVQGTSTFTIPQGTFVLAGEGVRFAPGITGLYGSTETRLFYPNGVEAMRGALADNSPLRGERVLGATAKPTDSGYGNSVATELPEVGSPSLTKPPTSVVSPSQQASPDFDAGSITAAAAHSGGDGLSAFWMSVGGVVLLIALGSAGVYYAGVTKAPPPEFDIET